MMSDAYHEGQIAGLVAVLSALVDSLPPDRKAEFSGRLHANFEPLIAIMLADDGADAEQGLEGAEWIRDLFLSNIKSV